MTMTRLLTALSVLIISYSSLVARTLPLEVSLNDQRSHVQGISWDAQKKQMFFSVTTRFVVTDASGAVKGSVEGLHGHLGAMVFDSASRRAYASMECKDDVIGSSISRQLGVEGYKESTFYIAEIDVDAVTGMNTPAEKAIKYHEVKPAAEDYAAEVMIDGKALKHRYACSGIDGITIGPAFGHKTGDTARYIYVAYGIYSDTTRTDNDCQVLLQYRLDDPDRLVARYFIKTGNTNFGIQNLAYDTHTDKLFMVVYKGKKSWYPNYDIFSVNMSSKPYKGRIEGVPYQKGNVSMIPPGTDNWFFKWGKQGLCSLGDGYWYITEDTVHKDSEGKYMNDCTVCLYHWNKTGEKPFSRVESTVTIPECGPAAKGEKNVETAYRSDISGFWPIADETVIARSSDPNGIFLYTPAITEGNNGRLIVAVDCGGPGTEELDGPLSCTGDYISGNQVRVILSDDGGQTWRDTGTRLPMLHEILFKAGGSLYMLGHAGRLLCTRSVDNGESWSDPVTLREDGAWHQSCGAVDVSDSKVTLAYERWISEGHPWPGTGPVLMQADETADLTDPAVWTYSEMFNPDSLIDDIRRTGCTLFPASKPDTANWNQSSGILETNVVRLHDSSNPMYDTTGRNLMLLARANTGFKDVGAILKGCEHPDGTLSIEQARVNGTPLFYTHIPGGHLKFNLCWDPVTRLYWMVHSSPYGTFTERRVLALSCSADLLSWTKAGVVAVAPSENSSRNYATLLISGKDMLIVSRSGDLNARNSHDGNIITLHRIENFREFAPREEPTEIPFSCAHRGGHIDGVIPENSTAGVAMAARYGYRAIECDVHYTKDSVLVCMHDGTINRVMRTAEGYKKLPAPVKYREVNYDELRTKYVLASSDPSLRTPIASFEEILAACKEYGITAMLHSDEPEAYKRACEVLGPKGFIAFDVKYEALKRARDYSKECLILWDPDRTPAEEVIPKLKALGGPAGISSMKRDLLTKEYVGAVRDAGFSVQASIFNMPGDIEAEENGCNIILSDFSLFPPEGSHVRVQPRHQERANRHLDPGETIQFTWDKVRYGSIELQIDFTGEVDIHVNDDVHYTLTGKDRYLIDGWRFYEKNPSFTITAKEESYIKRMRVSLFEY